ncbi:HicB_like antitoxin of toxin-antitoxin system [Methylocapsa palsarum]|uniref:HicB_like antitoxin of toxin-antitoxin system n=1 Tax=Methylocapsa palsarum TaxID=1612308 RepID=A0A1I3ZTN9_9HYPH|nr:HicB_like antitoxin of toxin-antitoxin system [Methylocapsa palsarum]
MRSESALDLTLMRRPPARCYEVCPNFGRSEISDETQRVLPGCKLVQRLTLMAYYIAIVEEEEDKAVGVWFPDLPGCLSAGDTLDEAMLNAAEALELLTR